VDTDTYPYALDVRHLVTAMVSGSEAFPVVDDVSLRIKRGESFGVVGESGSGKSMTALSVLGLLPASSMKVVSGELLFGGRDLRRLTAEELRDLRGARLGAIFQEPMTALNPVMRIGHQIAEAMWSHLKITRAAAVEQAVGLLEKVGIREPRKTAGCFPHELSGGMRQRAMIAIAIACKPDLLIADEPTTALDVTVQAQVLDLIDDLRRQLGAAVMLITHNFGVIAQHAERVAVMYAGQIVEEAPTAELLRNPRHPYTRGLLDCVPRLGSRHTGVAPQPLPEITGSLPDLRKRPAGCAFAPRCPHRVPACMANKPQLVSVSREHRVRCIVNAPSGVPA
jgi:oligopeptide/dipeptide ABC transporter ATP-binding protein